MTVLKLIHNILTLKLVALGHKNVVFRDKEGKLRIIGSVKYHDDLKQIEITEYKKEMKGADDAYTRKPERNDY